MGNEIVTTEENKPARKKYVLKKREYEGYLTSFEEKVKIARKLGLDYYIVIDFITYSDATRPTLVLRNIHNGEIRLDDVDFVTENEYERIRKRCNPNKNDILISCSGSIGRVCVIQDNNKNQYVWVPVADGTLDREEWFIDNMAGSEFITNMNNGDYTIDELIEYLATYYAINRMYKGTLEEVLVSKSIIEDVSDSYTTENLKTFISGLTYFTGDVESEADIKNFCECLANQGYVMKGYYQQGADLCKEIHSKYAAVLTALAAFIKNDMQNIAEDYLELEKDINVKIEEIEERNEYYDIYTNKTYKQLET